MRLLIVAPAWVGDMVMAQALVAALLQRFQAPEIHLLAPPSSAPLGSRMPGVGAVHELAAGHGELALKQRLNMARRLRRLKFQRAYVLPNSFKSALVPWLAGIPERIGQIGECRLGLLTDARRLDRQARPRMVDQFAALAWPRNADTRKAPMPRLEADPQNLACLCKRLNLDQCSSVTAICPGAEFGPAKSWPARHFAAVARARLQSGADVWILGSQGDAALGAHVAELAPGSINLCGQTSLTEALDLLSACDAAITNDSGLMHIACALGVRTIALYGASSPTLTPPLHGHARALQLALPCQPCFQRSCLYEHTNCLNKLPPQAVLAELQREPADATTPSATARLDDF